MKQKTFLIAPSILSADFAQLKKEVQDLEKAGADRLHLDVMDGCFVPNLSFGPPVVNRLRKISRLPMDVHLMVQEPQKLIPLFDLKAGDSLIFHIESHADPAKLLQNIRKKGLLAGLTLKPDTKLERIYPFLSKTDIILIMTVHPGFSGQKLKPAGINKLKALKAWLNQKKLNIPVQVDGGVNADNAPKLKSADVLVSGSFILKHSSYKQAISLLKQKKGALMVEYALLIVACVVMAMVLLDAVKVGSGPGDDSTGFIIKKWWSALQVVAEDT